MSDQVVPDSEHHGLVARLPQLPRDLALLANERTEVRAFATRHALATFVEQRIHIR